MRGRPLDHVIYVMDHTIVDDVQVFTLYGLLKHDEAIFGERDDRRQQVLGDRQPAAFSSGVTRTEIGVLKAQLQHRRIVTQDGIAVTYSLTWTAIAGGVDH
ncbi:hypothetical protein EHS25_001855 [Saitozyma podzolica]|uniref:Uncharacterized protein n=1 Tax=Saitozyma podzolica TaxID=1890683 RepID=A0A427YFA7_9TREE|nr:hypothetical protein EHS25_001855 [Saitozyma podzolica]